MLHQRSNRQPESELAGSCGARGGGWLRWGIFAGLIVAGAFFIVGYIKPWFLHVLAWVAFGMVWVPASFYLSRRVVGFLSSNEVPDSFGAKKPLGLKPRCPNCKSEILSEQTLCPSCYEDLLNNCQDCGQVIQAPHKVCRECASKHRGRKLRMRGM